MSKKRKNVERVV